MGGMTVLLGGGNGKAECHEECLDGALGQIAVTAEIGEQLGDWLSRQRR